MDFVASRLPLAWRVFLVNAAVLVAVSVFYVSTPATISDPVSHTELLVLAFAVALSLVMNLVLLGRAFAPLDELRRLMQRVDPLDPGRRIQLPRADADVAALAQAFNHMLDRVETERRESARRSLAAQEHERRRLALDLHDELGQKLTGVLLLLDEADRLHDGAARASLDEAREATRTSIDEVRRIVRDLRPEVLDDLGLQSAIAAIASSFQRLAGVDVERRVASQLPALAPDQELVVYRFVQEALNNVARHADARHVVLAVEPRTSEIRVTVRDDGGGFSGTPAGGEGIRGMRERALSVRAVVTVRSGEGDGTEISLRMPLDD